MPLDEGASEKEIAAANEARDLALEAAANAQAQLENQTELLKQVDRLTTETGERAKEAAAKQEEIDALSAEVAKLRAVAADAKKAAAEGVAAAEAAENKIADRVTQTLQAAETCVSTAEQVKKEVERNAAEAGRVAAQTLDVLIRSPVCEASLKRCAAELAAEAAAAEAPASPSRLGAAVPSFAQASGRLARALG